MFTVINTRLNGYFIQILSHTPLKHIIRTRLTAAPITFKSLIVQKIFNFNRSAYWPVHFTSIVSNPKNILIGVGTAPGLSPGCYIQGIGKIIIGDYTMIASNVGIISANHDIYNNSIHRVSEVIIGNYCWLGMNSMILPGVVLGDHTIVAAGTIVTKPFPEGYCVLAGNPAKIVKKVDPELVVEYKNEYEYCGYIPISKFDKWRRKNLNL